MSSRSSPSVTNFNGVAKYNKERKMRQAKRSVVDSADAYVTSSSQTRSAVYNDTNELMKSLLPVYNSADGTIYQKRENGVESVEQISYPTKNVIHTPGYYHELYRQSLTVDELPQSIKHKFGSRESESLLSDQLKVHDTLSKIHNAGIIKKADKTESAPPPPPPPPVVTPSADTKKRSEINDYYDLGNHLRFAIGHGCPQVHKESFKNLCHNASVNLIYLSDPKNVDSPYRRKWMEHDVVRSRISRNLELAKAEKIKEKKS